MNSQPRSGARPTASSVGNVMSDPDPMIALIAQASKPARATRAACPKGAELRSYGIDRLLGGLGGKTADQLLLSAR